MWTLNKYNFYIGTNNQIENSELRKTHVSASPSPISVLCFSSHHFSVMLLGSFSHCALCNFELLRQQSFAFFLGDAVPQLEPANIFQIKSLCIKKGKVISLEKINDNHSSRKKKCFKFIRRLLNKCSYV